MASVILDPRSSIRCVRVLTDILAASPLSSLGHHGHQRSALPERRRPKPLATLITTEQRQRKKDVPKHGNAVGLQGLNLTKRGHAVVHILTAEHADDLLSRTSDKYDEICSSSLDTPPRHRRTVSSHASFTRRKPPRPSPRRRRSCGRACEQAGAYSPWPY